MQESDDRHRSGMARAKALTVAGLCIAIAGCILLTATYLDALANNRAGIPQEFAERALGFALGIAATTTGSLLVVRGSWAIRALRGSGQARETNARLMTLEAVVGMGSGMTLGAVVLSLAVDWIAGGLVALFAGAGHILEPMDVVLAVAALCGSFLGLAGTLIIGLAWGGLMSSGGAPKWFGKVCTVCALADVALGLAALVAMLVSTAPYQGEIEAEDVPALVIVSLIFWLAGGSSALIGSVVGVLGAGVGGAVGLLGGKAIGKIRNEIRRPT